MWSSGSVTFLYYKNCCCCWLTYNIIDWLTLFTWLWRPIPVRLSKGQSTPTAVHISYLRPDDHTGRTTLKSGHLDPRCFLARQLALVLRSCCFLIANIHTIYVRLKCCKHGLTWCSLIQHGSTFSVSHRSLNFFANTLSRSLYFRPTFVFFFSINDIWIILEFEPPLLACKILWSLALIKSKNASGLQRKIPCVAFYLVSHLPFTATRWSE